MKFQELHDEIHVKSMRRIIVDFEGWKITIWLKPERTILELVKGKIYKNNGFLIPEYITLYYIYIYIHMGVSENSVPLNPLVFMIIIPMKNGCLIGNIPNIFRQTQMENIGFLIPEYILYLYIFIYIYIYIIYICYQ